MCPHARDAARPRARAGISDRARRCDETSRSSCLQQLSRALGFGRRRRRLGCGLSRRHRRQCRPARHRPGSRRFNECAPVDSERLPADARIPDPARRLARRSLRTPPHLHSRGWPLHLRLAAVRDCAERRDAGRREAGAGHRRRAPDARQPGDHRVHLPAGRSRPRHRRLVRAWRGRHRSGAAARRLSGRGGFLACDLLDQPSPWAVRHGHGHATRAGDA